MGADINLAVEVARLEGELERARIELDTARYNEAHWKDCALKADKALSDYKAGEKKQAK